MFFSRKIIKSNRVPALFRAAFSKKKREKDDSQPSVSFQKQTVVIQEKYQAQSAALYDQYIKLRSRPLLTLDNYQIAYTIILQRPPIFVPFKPKHFEYQKTKYQFLKKTNKYFNVPKQLQIDRPENMFAEYERVNAENTITHRHTISKTEVYEYAENSRYWRYSDPTIEDDKSLQHYGTETVFFIIKDKLGDWRFPYRILTEKDKHSEVFTLMTEEMFSGAPNPLTFFETKKPIYARRIEDDSLQRGKGIQEMFYKGFTVCGVPVFPTENYADYAWVPKPLLSKYFKKDYFEETVSLVLHPY